MSIQNLIIYQFTPFYEIFKEIEKELNFNIIEALDTKTLKSKTITLDNLTTETTYIGKDDILSEESIDVVKGHGDINHED